MIKLFVIVMTQSYDQVCDCHDTSFIRSSCLSLSRHSHTIKFIVKATASLSLSLSLSFEKLFKSLRKLVLFSASSPMAAACQLVTDVTR